MNINKDIKLTSNISLFIETLNSIIDSINQNYKKNQLYSHHINISFDFQDSPTQEFSFFFSLDSNVQSTVIHFGKINPNYLIPKLIEILNKSHLINSHIRMTLSSKKNEKFFFELQSKTLAPPQLNQIVENFGTCYFGEEEKLPKDNYFIKRFENDKLFFEVCYIFHSFSNLGMFDLILFNNRKLKINLSKNKEIVNELKSGLLFNLQGEENCYINFNKLKTNLVSLFIFGNYEKKENKIDECKNENDENKVSKFIIESMKSVNNEIYEKIKIFVDNKLMKYYFDTIVDSLKYIYTSTTDQEIYNLYEKLFEPVKNDCQYLYKKLTKNFMLSKQK